MPSLMTCKCLSSSDGKGYCHLVRVYLFCPLLSMLTHTAYSICWHSPWGSIKSPIVFKGCDTTSILKFCFQLCSCLALHMLLECTCIKVRLITSLLVKPSSRTLLVQIPQLTFVSRNRIPAISFSFFLYTLPGARFGALLAGVHCTLWVAG